VSLGKTGRQKSKFKTNKSTIMKNPVIPFFQILLVAGLFIFGAPALSAQDIPARNIEQIQKEKPQAKAEQGEQQTKIVKNKERKQKRAHVGQHKGNKHGTIKGNKGKAYGKNKGELNGKDFGQQRAKAARAQKGQHKDGNCGPGGEDKPEGNKARKNKKGTQIVPNEGGQQIKQ
jgi:hypothetical protein